MLKIFNTASIIFSLVAITGCATSPPDLVWKSTPDKAIVENSSFIAELVINCQYFKAFWLDSGDTKFNGCKVFELSIKNKTSSNIELDWNKTLYVDNGQTSGGFMIEGTVIADRNNSKPSDIIFVGGTLKRVIWPSNLVYFDGFWSNRNMAVGEQGIFLSMLIDGKVVNEKITMQLTSKEVQ